MYYTNNSQLHVSGTISPTAGKTIADSYIILNGIAIPITPAFSVDLTLQEGINDIAIHAVDSAGSASVKSFQILLDTIPSVISIANTENATSSPIYTLHGSFSDANLLSANSIVVKNLETGSSVYAVMSNDGSFTSQLYLTEGLNHLIITITDNAGNKNSITYEITLDTSSPVIILYTPASLPYSTSGASVDISGKVSSSLLSNIVLSVNGITAGQKSLTASGEFSFTSVNLPEGSNIITLNATNTGGKSGILPFTATSDRTPPSITINQPNTLPGTTDAYTQFQQNIPVELATDENAICTINKMPSGTVISELSPWSKVHSFTYGYYLAPSTAPYQFNLTCKDSVSNSKTIFMNLHVDPVAPTVSSVSASPNPILDFTDPLVYLTAATDKLSECRYIENSTSIQPILNQPIKEYAYSIAKPFDTISYNTMHTAMLRSTDFSTNANGNYTFYVICKNIAGLLTSNVGTVTLEMNLNWPLMISSKGPSEYVNTPAVELYATTNLNATCTATKSTSDILYFIQRFLGLSTPLSGRYNHTVAATGLSDGYQQYTVDCTAADNPSKTAAVIIAFDVDTSVSKPVIIMPTPDMPFSSSSLAVAGTAEANSTIKIYKNGVPVSPNPIMIGTSFSGSVGFASTETGLNTIKVEVHDQAGNVNSEEVTVIYTTQNPTVTNIVPPDNSINGFSVVSIIATLQSDYGIGINFSQSSIELENSSGIMQSPGAFSNNGVDALTLALAPQISPLSQGNYTVLVTAQDILGRSATSTFHFSIDLSAPTITLLSPIGPKTNKQVVDVAGTILASSKITLATLQINEFSATNILNGSNTGFMQFNVSKMLTDGQNNITINATSLLGTQVSSNLYTITLDRNGPIGIVTLD